MTRLIDVDALNKEFIDFIRASNNSGIMPNWNDAVSLVGSAPTVDAVPVVRCGECSHSEVCKMDDGDVRYCHIFEMQTEDDYYCADGESLEEDDLRTSANHDGERLEDDGND